MTQGYGSSQSIASVLGGEEENPLQFLRYTSATTVDMPEQANAVFELTPDSGGETYRVPEGEFDGQMIQILVTGDVNSSSDLENFVNLNVRDGIALASPLAFVSSGVSFFPLRSNESISMVWSESSGYWRATATNLHERGEVLIFAGSVAEDQIVMPGWNTLIMDQFYDPLSAYDTASGVYYPQDQGAYDYRTVYTFKGGAGSNIQHVPARLRFGYDGTYYMDGTRKVHNSNNFRSARWYALPDISNTWRHKEEGSYSQTSFYFFSDFATSFDTGTSGRAFARDNWEMRIYKAPKIDRWSY